MMGKALDSCVEWKLEDVEFNGDIIDILDTYKDDNAWQYHLYFHDVVKEVGGYVHREYDYNSYSYMGLLTGFSR